MTHPIDRFAAASLAGLCLALSACTTPSPEPQGPLRKETVLAVDEAGDLLRFNAGQPQRVLDRKPLTGLAPGEKLVGMDFRVARGVLFGLGTTGQLYTIDAKTAKATPVGSSRAALNGTRFGVDFNPVADRIRVVSDAGQNLRLHPDTGAVAAVDPALSYADGRAAPAVIAAAYTYNKDDDKLTTNYAIDAAAGTLVRQGSLEGVQPVVSPNTGKLTTVGPLGTGPLEDASFDIDDVRNTPLAALRANGRTKLYVIDLTSGKATLLGTIGDGRPVHGLAIEP